MKHKLWLIIGLVVVLLIAAWFIYPALLINRSAENQVTHEPAEHQATEYYKAIAQEWDLDVMFGLASETLKQDVLHNRRVWGSLFKCNKDFGPAHSYGKTVCFEMEGNNHFLCSLESAHDQGKRVITMQLIGNQNTFLIEGLSANFKTPAGEFWPCKSLY